VHEAPHIGVACAGDPRDPRAYSGVPAGVYHALEDLGVQVEPIVADNPDWWEPAFSHLMTATKMRGRDFLSPREGMRRRRAAAKAGRGIEELRTWTAARQVRHKSVEGVIQCGTQYRLPSDLRTITFEDSTVTQALASYDWPHLRTNERDLRRATERARISYQRAVACCARTHWVADSLIRDFGQAPERVHVIGVGKNHIPEVPERRDWSKPRYLFVGKDWERKNGPRVLAAFRRVQEQRPDAELHVVGRHPENIGGDGVYGYGLLALERDEDRRLLDGLYGSATCFVMPSLHEPAGIVYAEAGAGGVASIGTSNGGSATIIGDCGRLVDPESEEQIFEAMLELSSPSRAARLGELARKRSELFTWQKVAQRLMRALALPELDTSGFAEFL
jgi:hypothetical protein